MSLSYRFLFSPITLKKIEKLPIEKKKKISLKYLQKAKAFKGNKKNLAIQYLDIAITLNPSQFEAYLQKAILLVDIGKKRDQKKCYQAAHQLMKKAEPFVPEEYSSFWVFWADLLFLLGEKLHSVFHFLKAQKKLEKALSVQACLSKKILAEIYWKKGLNELELAEFSEEAVDYQQAIYSFQNVLAFTKEEVPFDFWKQYGYAYLQLGLLVNESALYLKACNSLQKALATSSKDEQVFSYLGESYTQLYINTLNEAYFTKAHHIYAKAVKHHPLQESLWLHWACLLAEAGKVKKDKKKIHLSIEKCRQALRLSKDPAIVAQWIESLARLGIHTQKLDLLLEAEIKIGHAVEKHPDSPDLWYSYAVVLGAFASYYEDLSYYDLAIEKAQEGLTLDRSYAELWHLMGSFYTKIGIETEDIEALELARKFFYRALNLKPACPEIYYDTALALSQLSELSGNRKILEEGLEYFIKLFQQQKEALLDHPEWLFSYAYALALKGNEKEEKEYLIQAIEVYWQVILIQPDYPQLYLQLALTFSHLGEITSEKIFFQKSFHYYSIASKKEEENDQIWLEWGISLIHLALLSFEEKNEELLLHAERKLAHAGRLGNPYAYYHLSCLYSLLGKLDTSMYFFEKAQKLKILPPLEEILQDEWLEALRETEAFSSFLHKLESKQDHKLR